MKVLSLFDGISCGMVALERAGIPVERYVAYEIDKYAIEVSEKNYPQIEHCGDVTTADFEQYKGFDLLIGGSPCTFWSIAKANREVTPDGIGGQLFMHYVRALKESGCKYFLYENNYSIHKDIKAFISEQLGVEPIMINSSLLSAQQRKRCYWTNIPNVVQPEDKGILLKDVLESGTGWQEKSYCLTASYDGAVLWNTLERKQRTMIAEPVNTGCICHNIKQMVKVRKHTCDIEVLKELLRSHKTKSNKEIAEILNKPITLVEHWFRKDNCFSVPDENTWFDLKKLLNIETDEFDAYVTEFEIREGAYEKADRCYDVNGKFSTLTTGSNDNLIAPIRLGQIGKGGQGQRIYSVKGKSVTLSANGGGQGAKTGLYKIDLPDGDYLIRKLTPVEAERLQTLPDNYTDGISKTQRYKCIGNGWTVDVIAHILKNLKK